VAPGEWLVVHGCGGVGLAAVALGVALGARVLGVDGSAAAREQAAALGAEATFAPGRDLVAQLVEATDGGPHVSIDAIGSPAVCADSVLSLRPRGRHVQVGLLLGDHAFAPVPMGRVIARELEVLGVHGLPARDYPGLLDLVTTGRLDLGRLVGRVIGLSEAGAALAALGGPPAYPGVTVVDLAR